MPVGVLLEEGRRRSFASALDWPGWARSGRTPMLALEALESYRERYAGVLTRAGLTAPTSRLSVTVTCPGDATTDFGAPSVIVDADRRALRRADRERLAAQLAASWAAFDVAASRRGALASGPRGGGRSRAQLVRHVDDAEVAYARGLGLRVSDTDGTPAKVAALRARVLEVVRGAAPDREGRWPLRYGVRRIAWHALDHCFELEDREA